MIRETLLLTTIIALGLSTSAFASTQIPVNVVDNNMYSGGRVQDVSRNIVAELTTKAQQLCGTLKLTELSDLSIEVKGGGLVRDLGPDQLAQVSIVAPETKASAVAICE